MSDRQEDLVATASETVGPFFHFGLATDPALGCVADPSVPGDHITLAFRVTDGEGVAVPDALVEIWQVDAQGAPAPPPASVGHPAAFRGFGRLATNEHGQCDFHTVRPGRAGGSHADPQAPHINICLFARGLLRQVHTRVYFAGDPGLADDAVLAMVPAGRRATLLATRDAADSARWLFDLRLQGERETVFFEV